MFATKVKIFKTDNGSEFFRHAFQTLVSSLGILHQSTCVYTPQQNGVAERMHRTILNMARALRFQASVPLKFWGDCVLTSVYLLNKLPTRSLHYKTPFEILYSTPPSMSHIRTFGCLCYASSPKLSNKFSPRAIPTVMVGYSLTQKGYIIYDLHSHSLFVNRHIVFKEDVFPFKDTQSSSDPIFPVLTFVCPDSHIPVASISPPIPISPSVPSASSSPLVPTSSALNDHPFPPASSPISAPTPALPPRKFSKHSKPPLWLQDFVTKSKSTTCSFPLSNYMSYTHLSPSYSSIISAYSAITETSSYKEVALDPQWVYAMNLEIAALEDNNTWTFVNFPPGEKPIGWKWVYKVKYKATCEVERLKARLVAKGFSQQEGLDYGETFSPIVKMVTVRTIIALAASKGWCIHQMDVHNAFLNDDLVEEVYMYIPAGFARQGELTTKVCKLHNSLYGLK